MKTISGRIWGVFLGLGVLGLIVQGLIVPSAAADEEYDRQWREAQDRANQEAQAQRDAQDRDARDRAYREAQAEQAARDRYYYEQQQQREAEYKAQADREAWDKYWRDVQADRDAADKAYWEAQKAQAERDAWYKSQEESRQFWENIRQQEEYDKYWQNFWGTDDWSAASDSTSRNVRQPAGLVILNPFALEKMKPDDQERVRQEATQMGQPIRQESEIIQNPFVPSPKYPGKSNDSPG